MLLTGIHALHSKQEKKGEKGRQNTFNIQSKFESHFAHNKSVRIRLSITILQWGIQIQTFYGRIL